MNRVGTNARKRFIQCSGLLLGVALPAYAQQDAEIRRLDKIVVTGSNIKRTDIEAALPVQVITREDIDRSGVTTVAALLQLVPANLIGSVDVPYRYAFAPTTANLRGLGDSSTLILINGRRVANFAVNGGAVNLRFIPLAAVERVEILKDGASAIYGADAMAGVINFILRKDFSGVQFTTYGGWTEHGGGNQQQLSLTAGYGELTADRFNAFANVSYQKETALAARDRPFSRSAYNAAEGVSNLNNETFPANVRVGSILLNPTFALGCMPPVTVPVPGTRKCGHDPLAVVNLLPPAERLSVFGAVSWQLAADQRLFAQYLYVDNRSDKLIRNQAPASQDFTVDHRPIVYPAGGPYYPTAFAASNGISGDLNLYYRTLPLGPLIDSGMTNAQQLVAGAEGTIAGWSYDAAWIYSANRQKFIGVSGRVSAQRLIAAMDTGLINPFGPSGLEGEALLAATEFPGEVFHAKAATDSFEAKATKDVVRLDPGPLALALGAEARRERLDVEFNPEQNSGDILGSGQGQSSSGDRTVEAVYAELNVPLATRLELQLAARYDHYSDFGGTLNPKIALRWQPSTALLFRSSFGTGFRAPTLLDLYTPLTRTGTTARRSDPLRCPITRAVNDCGVFFDVLTFGNPALDAETSNQFNVGAVWEPVEGLALGADYWNISKKRTIGTLTDEQIFANFDMFSDAHVVRGRVDSAYPALPGPIDHLVEGVENLGKLRTSGVDIDLRYRGPVSSLGRFGLSLDGTYVAQWRQQLDGRNYVDGAGRYVVGAVPRWRHYLAVTWNDGPWSATVAQTYSAGYVETNPAALHPERRVGSYDIWNVQGAYSGLVNTTITLGINNLFDRSPPFSYQTAVGLLMYDPRYADPRGRIFYGQLAFALK